MTEKELLTSAKAGLAKMEEELDALLASATPDQWKKALDDNGWTTAQIIEHLYRTSAPYEASVSAALVSAPAGDQSSQVKHKFFANFILKAMKKGNSPSPKMLVVTDPISAETAMAHWGEIKRITGKILAASEGKSLQKATFKNPFVKIMPMHAADVVALLHDHLAYHLPQLRRRLQG